MKKSRNGWSALEMTHVRQARFVASHRTQHGRRAKSVAGAPLNLPSGAREYVRIYRAFLEHTAQNGPVSGRLLEIGGTGQFLSFLQSHSFFRGMSARSVTRELSSEAPGRVRPGIARYYAEARPAGQPEGWDGNDFVIARRVFGTPGTNPESVLNAISRLTANGGKVFLEARKPDDLPQRTLIENTGFRVIEERKGRGRFILVLKKVR